MSRRPPRATRTATLFPYTPLCRAVEPEALMDRARGLAATIASRAPIAAETAKLNLRAAVSMPLDKAMEYERDLQAICFATEDAEEGRAAFAEKRPPQFRRR